MKLLWNQISKVWNFHKVRFEKLVGFFCFCFVCSTISKEDTIWYDSSRRYKKWGFMFISESVLMFVQNGILGNGFNKWRRKKKHFILFNCLIFQILNFEFSFLEICVEGFLSGWSMYLGLASEQIMDLSRFDLSCFKSV